MKAWGHNHNVCHTCAAWNAALAPDTPAPIMTTSRCFGSGAVCRIVSCCVAAGKPAIQKGCDGFATGSTGAALSWREVDMGAALVESFILSRSNSMVVMFVTNTSTQNKQVEGDGCSSDDDDDGVKHTKCGKDGVMATHQVRVCLYFLLFADSHACCNFMAFAA